MKFNSQLQKLAKYQGYIFESKGLRMQYNDVYVSQDILCIGAWSGSNNVMIPLSDIDDITSTGNQVYIHLQDGRLYTCVQSQTPIARWKYKKTMEAESILPYFEISQSVCIVYKNAYINCSADFRAWNIELTTDPLDEEASAIKITLFSHKKFGATLPVLQLIICEFDECRLVGDNDNMAMFEMPVRDQPFSSMLIMFFKSQVQKDDEIVHIEEYLKQYQESEE